MKKIIAAAVVAVALAGCSAAQPYDWKEEVRKVALADNDPTTCEGLAIFGGVDEAQLAVMASLGPLVGDKTLEDVAEGDLDWLFAGDEGAQENSDLADVVARVPLDTRVMDFAGVYFDALFERCAQ